MVHHKSVDILKPFIVNVRKCFRGLLFLPWKIQSDGMEQAGSLGVCVREGGSGQEPKQGEGGSH